MRAECTYTGLVGDCGWVGDISDGAVEQVFVGETAIPLDDFDPIKDANHTLRVVEAMAQKGFEITETTYCCRVGSASGFRTVVSMKQYGFHSVEAINADKNRATCLAAVMAVKESEK